MDGHVPQNGDAVLLGDSLGIMLLPSFVHFNAKLFADHHLIVIIIITIKKN